jgi:hypothetical protein
MTMAVLQGQISPAARFMLKRGKNDRLQRADEMKTGGN